MACGTSGGGTSALGRPTHRARGARLFLGSIAAFAALALPANALAEADFQLLVSPAQVTVAPGQTTTLHVGVGAIDGFSAPVSLSVSGLPTGVTAQFSVNPITPSGVSDLVLSAAPNAAAATVAIEVTASGGGKTHVSTGRETTNLTMLKVCFGTIAGTVRDAETGALLTGVELRVTPGLDPIGPPAATTGADGTYRIQNVGLGPRNADRALFVAANLRPDYWPARSDEQTIGCGRTTQIDLTLVRVRPAHLVGTVFEGTPDPSDPFRVIPTTTPATGVTTYLDPIDHRAPFEVPAIVTPDGRFEFRFPVGYNNAPLSTSLNAFTSGDNEDEWRQGYWFSRLTLSGVQPGAELQRDIAVVRKCTFALSGRVVDAATNQPIPGAFVNVGTSEDFDTAVAGADGTFSFPKLLLGHNNAPTQYFADANLVGYDGGFASGDVSACGGNHETTLRMTPLEYHFGSIEGVVRDEETLQPLPGITVFLDFSTGRCGSPPRFEAPCQTTTDAAGRYRIGPVLTGHAPDDTYSTLVRTQQQFPPPYYDATAPVTIAKGDPPTQQDLLLLRRRFGAVAGLVRDVITKQPVTGARVTVSAGGALTGSDGRYTIGGLHLSDRNTPRSTDASVSAFAYWPATAEDIPLAADVTTPRDFELMPLCQNAEISGRVTDQDTALPIANATVTGGGRSTVTGTDGRYALTEVPVGNSNSPTRVTLTALRFDYHASSTEVTVFCGAKLQVDLPPDTGAVSVKKTVNGAAPAAGQTFTFRLRRGASAGTPGTLVGEAAAPAAGGSPATFPNLAPGTYQLCEIVPANWTTSLAGFTLPGGETCASTTVTASTVTNVDVDNRSPVDPPPTCVIEEQGTLADRRGFIRFRVQDVGSGLARYQVVYVRNATVSVSPFTPGTLQPVTVTATAVNANKSLGVEVHFFDLAGNKAVCDPIVLVVARTDDQPEEEQFTGVPQSESKVTILNGDPGMKKVQLTVNGVKFKEQDLGPGEVRKFDVASAMRPGSDNTITVSARGKKGATAVIVIADID